MVGVLNYEIVACTMKILLAHNNFAVTGGAEVFYHEVGRVLSERGHQVAYFSAMSDTVETSWKDYFPPVASHSQGSLLSKAINFPRMVYNRSAKYEMGRLIKDFKPDIIHAFGIYGRLTPAILDAAREAGVPVVMSCNDYKHICPNYKLYHHGKICGECKGGRFYRAIVNRCCHDSLIYSVASTVEAYTHTWMNIYRKNVHTFLYASEFMAHKTEEFWGKGTFKWEMLRNPFDTSKYLLKGEVGDYALYFGRLIGEKGVDVLLRAAGQAPDVPLVIVGDGPDRAKLEYQAQVAGLRNVRFVGAKWGADLNDWLRNCRFVVVPSLWHENFPYVILQAFAAGKPVVGSNRGGIPELVAHGELGAVYEATDAAMLAATIRNIAAMPDDEVQQMGEKAKRLVMDGFNDDVFYTRLMEIYEGVLA